MRSRNNCRCQNQSAFSLMLGREGLGDTSAHTGDDDANSCLRSLKGIICYLFQTQNKYINNLQMH